MTRLTTSQHLPSWPVAAPRPFTFALTALVAALTGCSTVPQADEEIKPPPQVTTVSARQEGPLAPLPGAEAAAAPKPRTAKAPATPQLLVAASDIAVGEEAVVGTPEDPLNPGQSMVLNDANARKDLWGRIRLGFSVPTLDNDLVREHERWYASRPDYVRRMTERGSRYLFHVVEELQRRGMPTELALLPFIESAFNPQAMSSARASGMWQFMPMTGRDFSLKQNMFRDDRRDVLASTRAALDYLTRLNKMFNGDWQLALAAYNWGEGNVKKAIARNERAGLPTDYESLSMPAETRNYVPKLQAVKNIVAAPQNFGLELQHLENHPYFLSVPIRRDIDVSVAAKLAGLSLEEFKALNPQMNKPVILASGTPQVLLPYDNASTFINRLRDYQGQLASWTAWVVPKTMRSADAAREAGMSEEALRQMNRIPPKMLIKAGSTLLVQRSERREVDVPEHVIDNAHMALAPDVPPLRKVAIKARRGDTVTALARRYNVTPLQIARWNRIDDEARFRKPQGLVIWVPVNEAAAVAVAARDTRADREPAMTRRQLAAEAVREARLSKAEKRQLAAKGGKAIRLAALDDERADKVRGKKGQKTRVQVAEARGAGARGLNIKSNTRLARK